MSGAIVSVYAIFASDREAREIGRAVVERRLAACVNILGPCHSIYRWHGLIEEAEEVAALFKTAADRADSLIDAVRSLHSYETPAIVAWPIEAADPPYRDWIIAQTR